MNSLPLTPDSVPPMTTREVARFPKRTLKHLLKKLHSLIEDLRPGDSEIVEATHQLRVASRRADVALRVFRRWIPASLRRRMKSMLKTIRVDAGAVRDMDLLQMRWGPDAGAAALQVSPPAAAWLHARIQDRRASAFDHLIRWTHKSRRKRFRKQSRQLLCELKLRGKDRFARSVSRAISKLIDGFREAVPTTIHSLPDSHRTRICARRLRYGVELLQTVIPDSTTPLISSLESIQEQLGQINDDATANRFVRRSLSVCRDPEIAASLQSWLDHSEAAAMNRLVELSIQMPSPTQSLSHFLSQAD